MNKQIFLSLIILSGVIQGRCADKLDDAFQKLRDAVDHGEIPGYIALVARESQVIRHEAYGLRDIENQLPFTTNTLCWIADYQTRDSCGGHDVD